MKKKIIIFILICIAVFLLKKERQDNYTSIPKITLKGKIIINLIKGEKYNEPGYKATDDKDGDITNKVKVKGSVNYKTPGIYEISYTVKNSSMKKAKIIRYVKVKKKTITYKNEYDNIDNTSRGWWSGNKFDNKRPSGGADINELKKYNTFFLGKDEKIIYLTFDEGSLETYLENIVEILNKNEVKGTFFLCKKYISQNANLIRKMINNGHSIGNHTHHHKNMPSLATKENFSTYIKEIKDTEDAFDDITKKNMDKIYREPRGEWSYRDLKIMKDLGYKTFFYSANYDDFTKTLTKEEALAEMMKRYHNGAIYLIHPNNKGNYEAIESFIIEMKKQGYKFDLVKNI